MDTLTQIALGATVAEAGFRHRLGGKAVVFGAACGLLPDLDMLARLAGELTSLVHHRGITHSLLTLTLLSPLVGYAGYRWARRTPRSGAEADPGTAGSDLRQWLLWTHLAFWALVTHPLLDVFTTYGTQLFAPVTDHRYALDAVSIVDLACSLPLWTIALVALLRWRREPGPRRRWLARFALAWSTAYLLVAFGLSQAVVHRAEKQLQAEGFAPVAVRAVPTFLVTGAWRVVARNRRGDLRQGAASSWAAPRIAFTRFDRPRDPLVDKGLASRPGKMLQWFSAGMIRVSVKRSNRLRAVVLEDARFGLLSDPRAAVFRLQLEFDQTDRLRRVRRLSPRMRFRVSDELGAWWRVYTTGRL